MRRDCAHENLGSTVRLELRPHRTIDSTPDTVVTLVDGKKYVVLESSTQVAASIRLYRSEIIALSHHLQPEDLGLVDPDAPVAHLSPVTPITREV